MPRRRRAWLPALLVLGLLPSTAAAHAGDPSYRSEFRGVVPAVPGLRVQVLGYDNQFELINRTGRTVQIPGYSGEPYARLLPDGTVQVNQRAPTRYLNEDRLAETPVPASASASAPPQWRTIDKTGRFVWHDHRMHWMGKALPPPVKDKSKRTKIFDYRIPVEGRGGERGRLTGTLFWVGEPRPPRRRARSRWPWSRCSRSRSSCVVRLRRRERAAGWRPEAW